MLDFNFFALYQLDKKANNEANEPLTFYGDGWKIKYFDLLEKYNLLLEQKISDYFKNS